MRTFEAGSLAMSTYLFDQAASIAYLLTGVKPYEQSSTPPGNRKLPLRHSRTCVQTYHVALQNSDLDLTQHHAWMPRGEQSLRMETSNSQNSNACANQTSCIAQTLYGAMLKAESHQTTYGFLRHPECDNSRTIRT